MAVGDDVGGLRRAYARPLSSDEKLLAVMMARARLLPNCCCARICMHAV